MKLRALMLLIWGWGRGAVIADPVSAAGPGLAIADQISPPSTALREPVTAAISALQSARTVTYSETVATTGLQPESSAPPLLTGARLSLAGILMPADEADEAELRPDTRAPFTSKSIWRDLFACDVPADRLWSFEFGVGVISDNTLADFSDGKLTKLQGPGGGITYNFTVTRRIHQFRWNIGPVTLRPEIEVSGRLTLVDENTGRVIPDLNIGLVLRWRDFPWTKFLSTTLAAGPGMSYSFQPWTADYQRHPEDPERSRLKFWLPIELTVALPWFPRHQVLAFIDHQSGGTLFDYGGVDVWGLGYRFEF